ncbi:MAG: 2-hydroxyacyl-CoA dehydratase family protein [Clostridiales bacterium]|jgi:benzoyl-CoA reductase/2-hydroxyglutaryl-CoA dehydratase subunit BcrC/BadD/HgdB|nr:2-hydroxyacyl-CoA dehydratase family protein [Clostridiales bacterium]
MIEYETEYEYVRRLRLAMSMPSQGMLRSKKLIWKMNYEDSRRAFCDFPGKYIATSMFLPSEIIAAMDYPFIPYEPLAVSVGMMDFNKGLIERSERHFEGMQLCSPIEVMIGMIEEEMIPPPGAIALSSYMCDDAQKMYELIARRYNCKSFFLDMPFDSNETSIKYIEEQIKSLVSFLEEYIGKKMDPESLKKAIDRSNKANDLRYKILEMRAKYQLTEVSDVFPLYPMFTKFGRKEPLAILEALYDEMREMIDLDRLFKPKYRIMWLGMIPLLHNKLIKTIERTYDAGIAIEENSLFSLWSDIDPERPYEGLAKKCVAYHPMGNVNRRIEAVNKFHDMFRVDGVIHFSHQGCRAYNGGVPFIAREMKRRGIPFVELNGDIIDRRNFNEGSLGLRLESFFDVIEGKRNNL